MKDKDIQVICKKYNITNYTINDDGSIDVDGDVYLSNKGLTKLPLNFRNVSGNFSCSYNQLTSLEGAPESVGDGFYCYNNKLTSLEGAPSSVVGHFYCHDNQLTSLESAPESVGGNFYCEDNSNKLDYKSYIKSLERDNKLKELLKMEKSDFFKLIYIV